MPDIDSMGAEEAELWYWCYLNETLEAEGRGRESYILVRDEDVMADTVATGRKLLDFSQISITKDIRTYLTRAKSEWGSHVSPWRELISSAHIELVERVLDRSPLAKLWDDNQVVSTIPYRWLRLN